VGGKVGRGVDEVDGTAAEGEGGQGDGTKASGEGGPNCLY